MNHIYRRIWSHAKQCWVVASEFAASSKTVSGVRRRPSMRSAAVHSLIAAMIATGTAQAATYPFCDQNFDEFEGACLPSLFSGGAGLLGATGSGYAVLGYNAYIPDTGSVSVGYSAYSAKQDVAVGAYAQALGYLSLIHI